MTEQLPSRTTVRDLAALTGVSIATVSRVLNDQGNVAPQTRDLVRRAMEQLGERAPSARTPRPRDGAVFVRCPYVLTDYFGIILSSIAETLESHGRHIMLNAGESTQRANILPNLSERPGISSAILILPPEESAQLAALRRRGLPFVVVDPRTAVPRDVVSVSAAHFSGARSLTSHLIQLGHRRIGVIAGPLEWQASDARLAGHNAAMAEVGVITPPELVHSVEPTFNWGHHAASVLLDLPERPTAIVCFNDKLAAGAMSEAFGRGLRVPEDLSIAGFDDIDLSRATRPTLTTVRQPLEEMGRLGVLQLLRLLDKERLDALHVELATELVVRASTGPVSI